jgi:cyclophilin family peptidyl-prolyl cis-trans isomerase
MHPEWAPIGASRFMGLIRDGAFDGTAIYRVVKRGNNDTEAVQFGAIKDSVLRQKWETEPKLVDDPQIFSNPNFSRGMISFAGSGPNSRATHVFITFMTGNANGNPSTVGDSIWHYRRGGARSG